MQEKESSLLIDSSSSSI